MSFVLDSDTCSGYLRGNGSVFNKFVQYAGGLYVSTITLAELYTWVHRSPQPSRRMTMLSEMLSVVEVLPVDRGIAERFGEIRAGMFTHGKIVATADLLIATTALVFNFTVVTHNVRHFTMVPNLRVEDWMAP